MSKIRKFNISPPLLRANGSTTNEISMNIGDNPPGATGLPGATGATGPSGNPNMLVTAPNGNVYEITVDNTGNLGTTLVSSAI